MRGRRSIFLSISGIEFSVWLLRHSTLCLVLLPPPSPPPSPFRMASTAAGIRVPDAVIAILQKEPKQRTPTEIDALFALVLQVLRSRPL